MVERPGFVWRFGKRERVAGRHEDVVDDEVMASSAAHPDY
jgi:hypothetical protein